MSKDPLGEVVNKVTSFLKLISGGEKIVIDQTDGKLAIGECFSIHEIIGDSEEYEINVRSSPTQEALAEVYDSIGHQTLEDIFKSLKRNLNDLCLSQGQIVDFVIAYQSKWLRMDGYGTLFFFKVKERYFVMRACWAGGGFYMTIGPIEDDDVWCAGCEFRIVVLQK